MVQQNKILNWMKITQDQLYELKAIYYKKYQFFGNGNFYQNFPLLSIDGTRDCKKRILTYRCRDFINLHDNILDIGCNTGFFSMEIAMLCNHIDGFDNETELIETAIFAKNIAKIENCNFWCDDFSYMEVTEKKYDIIFCLAIFEWMIKKIGMQKFIDNLIRISNPGSKIFYESHHLVDDICINADRIQIKAFTDNGYSVIHEEIFIDDCKRKITVLKRSF